MSINYIDRSHDEEIIDIMRTILNNGTWKIETINEAILAALMDKRCTPLMYAHTYRDIDADFERWVQDAKADVKPQPKGR